MAKASRSGMARRKAAAAKANEGKTGHEIASSWYEKQEKHSKKLSGTTSSHKPREKARAKARAKVSNRPKQRGFAG